MRRGYIVEHYGVYELRIEGTDFSKWFSWMREVRAYAKENKINLEACYVR